MKLATAGLLLAAPIATSDAGALSANAAGAAPADTSPAATLAGGVDPSKRGATVYPGAQPNPDSNGGLSAETPEGSTVMATGGASSATWQIGKDGAADQVVVQVNSDKAGQVTILITHVIKNNVSPAPSPT